MDEEGLPRLARKYEQAETDAERVHVGQKLHATIISRRSYQLLLI